MPADFMDASRVNPPQLDPSSLQFRDEPDPRRYQALAPAPPDGDIHLSQLWPDAGAAHDFEIEIGCGRGMFLLERAQAARESRILGIEIKRKWAYLVSERVARLGMGNARVFGADALDVLARIPDDACVARIFMHFPDPWWKKKHAKRRLRGSSLFDPAARLLRPGGEFFVQTDVEDRAEMLLEDLRDHGAFDVPESGYVADNPFGARSNREKRAITDGLPIYRVLVSRKA